MRSIWFWCVVLMYSVVCESVWNDSLLYLWALSTDIMNSIVVSQIFWITKSGSDIDGDMSFFFLFKKKATIASRAPGGRCVWLHREGPTHRRAFVSLGCMSEKIFCGVHYATQFCGIWMWWIMDGSLFCFLINGSSPCKTLDWKLRLHLLAKHGGSHGRINARSRFF